MRGPALLFPFAICVILGLATVGSKNVTNQVATEIKKQNTKLEPATHVARIKAPDFGPYKPAPVETFVVSHTKDLKLDVPLPEWTPSCHVITDPNATPYQAQLLTFIQELEAYYKLVDAFQFPIQDLRKSVTLYNNDVCDLVKLHPAGLPGIFNQSQQLSLSSSGWVEPLLPPMRHPKFCFEKGKRPSLMRMDYLIHDFQALCQKLKPRSRTVLVDMGASLSFHAGQQSPVLFLIQLYRKFGFKFDHVYGYEYTAIDAGKVFKDLPEHLDASYHWINVGVVADKRSRRNPFRMLLENYDKDDLIVVKLDVDTPELERELVQQILDNPKLAELIDHFYFEHHVNQEELRPNWGRGKGIVESVGDSLKLFQQLRQQGVPAHFWV